MADNWIFGSELQELIYAKHNEFILQYLKSCDSNGEFEQLKASYPSKFYQMFDISAISWKQLLSIR